MSGRSSDVLFALNVSPRERLALDDMATTSGLSCSNVVRTALFRFAQHLDQNTKRDLFAIRKRGEYVKQLKRKPTDIDPDTACNRHPHNEHGADGGLVKARTP